MASILKVDTIQDQSGNNIINENADTITIGASGDTITVPTGATLDLSNATQTGVGGVNTPAFNASLSSSQTLSHNVQTVIQFDNELYDVGGCYNNTGSTVTLNGISTPAYAFAPNVAGKYFFCGQVFILNSSSGADLVLNTGILDNGTDTYQNNTRYNTEGASGVTVSGTIEMNGTSDYIQLFGYQRNIITESGSRDARGDAVDGRIFCWFTAYKIIE